MDNQHQPIIPDVNTLLGATALVCGMRRSGKSNAIAVMVEELGRYYCPLCIGDSEDEYGPLADHRYLPRGQWAGSAALLPEMEQSGVRHYVALDLTGLTRSGRLSCGTCCRSCCTSNRLPATTRRRRS